MSQVKHLFHKLWGQCKDGEYDKQSWIALQKLIDNKPVQPMSGSECGPPIFKKQPAWITYLERVDDGHWNVTFAVGDDRGSVEMTLTSEQIDELAGEDAARPLFLNLMVDG